MSEPWTFRSAFVVVLAALAVTREPVARADDGAAARRDFRTGLSLLRQHEGVAACRMFERSYLEEAAPGTLYNLSLCREQQGRLDEAYRGFVELIAVAEQAHDTAKADTVKRKAAALRARLARLDLSRRDDVSAPITGIALDGAVLANDAWKAPVYVMPGTHQLSIRHDDGIIVTRTTEALRAGQTEALVIDDASAVPAPPPAAIPAAPVAGPPAAVPPTRIAAYVAGGAAVAFVGAGAVLGLLAISRKSAADEACHAGASPTGTTCASNDAAATATHDIATARTESTLSTIGFAVGAGAAATSALLFLVSRSPASDSAVGASFVAGPGAGGLAVSGRF